MVKIFAGVFSLMFPICAIADCGISLVHGDMRLSGLGLNRIDRTLAAHFTTIDRGVSDKSAVNEMSIECVLYPGYTISISELWGVRAGITRDVRPLSKFPQPEVRLSEDFSASASRVSLVKYFDFGSFSPFVRIGAESIQIEHRVDKPGAVHISTVSTSERKTAPYGGIGLTFGKQGSLTLRFEYQIAAPKPHKLVGTTLGISANF